MGLNNENTHEVRNRLRMFRKSLNLKQNDVASILHMEQASYSEIETGKTKTISRRVLKFLEQDLNLNIEWLLTGKGVMIIDSNIDNLYSGYDESRLIGKIGADKKTILITVDEYNRMQEQISQLIITNMNLSELLNKKRGAVSVLSTTAEKRK